MGIATREYRGGIRLSILGFGGMVLVGMDPDGARRIVAESADRGVNYFDVAPSYGDGHAQRLMGESLAGRRSQVFLAGKTLERTAAGASSDLDGSLRALRTDWLDLYQLHALSTRRDVEESCGPEGALQAALEAKAAGKVRFIGFSAHTVDAALLALDRSDFDSVLFPVHCRSFIAGFGPQVLQKARDRGAAVIALKAMAEGRWASREDRKEFPNCWYRPFSDPGRAMLALRFALDLDITAVFPPGDERLFRMALEFAEAGLNPLTHEELELLTRDTEGVKPMFR